MRTGFSRTVRASNKKYLGLSVSYNPELKPCSDACVRPKTAGLRGFI